MSAASKSPKQGQKSKSFFLKLKNTFLASWLFRFFTSYHAFDQSVNQNTRCGFFSRFRPTSLWNWFKRKAQKQMEQSRLPRIAQVFARFLLHSALKTYGMLCFFFGLAEIGIGIFVPQNYLPASQQVYLIVGIACTLIAVALLFSQKDLITSVRQSRFASFFFFRFLGIREDSIEENDPTAELKPWGSFAGIFFAAVTMLLSPVHFLWLLATLLLGYLVLLTPESGLILLLLLLPFFSTKVIFFGFAFTVFSFLLKILQDKRTFHMRGTDYAVFLFMIVLFLCGSVSVTWKQSLLHAGFYAFLLVIYFLVVNLMKTEKWIHRCFVAMTFTATLTALIGILQYFFGEVSTVWQDASLFAALRGRTVSTFDNPNILAEYLVLSLPVCLGLWMIQVKERKPIYAMFSFLLCAACLILTWSRGAWIAVAAALALFCLIQGKIPRLVFLGCVLLLPILFYWLPDTFIARITSITNLSETSNAYRLQIWDACTELLSSVWHTGIGWGDGVFGHFYPQFAAPGAEVAAHSHQLFLQIWISLGPLGILLFCSILILLLRYYCTLQTELYKISHSRTYTASLALLCAIVGLCIHGLTDFVWYQPRIFFLFWFVCGLLIMTGRSYYRERQENVSDPLTIELPYLEQKGDNL